jgi:hypothetical protein
MTIDGAITGLQEAGYFPGVPGDEVRRTLEAAIHTELSGGQVLTPEGHAKRAAELFDDQMAEARDNLLDEAGLSEAEMASLSDDDIDLDGTSNASTEAFMRAMGFTDQEIADETAKQAADEKARAAQDRAAPGPTESPADGAGSAEARPAAPRDLTDEQAFANDYAAFDGRTVEQPVLVADSGQTVTLKFDGAKVMRVLDTREKALKGLLDCLTKKAA